MASTQTASRLWKSHPTESTVSQAGRLHFSPHPALFPFCCIYLLLPLYLPSPPAWSLSVIHLKYLSCFSKNDLKGQGKSIFLEWSWSKQSRDASVITLHALLYVVAVQLMNTFFVWPDLYRFLCDINTFKFILCMKVKIGATNWIWGSKVVWGSTPLVQSKMTLKSQGGV